MPKFVHNFVQSKNEPSLINIDHHWPMMINIDQWWPMLTNDGQHWPMMINIDQWWSMLKYKATKVISWNKFCTFIFFIFIGETKKTTIDQWLQHGIAQCMFWGIEQCLQQTIEQCSFCYFHQWSWRWSTLINIGKWRWWAVEQRPFLPKYISQKKTVGDESWEGFC